MTWSDVVDDTLDHVILGHLSKDCNEPHLAIDAMQAAMRAKGHSKVHVECASQTDPTACLPAVRDWSPKEEIAPVTTEEPMIEERVQETALAYTAPKPASTSFGSFQQAELF